MSFLAAYRCIGTAAGPLIETYLGRRLRQGKEDAERLPERRGQASLPRPDGALVWLHAASVGEAASALILIDRLLATRPGLQVLVTTGTVTSAALLRDRLPPAARHQFVPVDRPGWVAAFLDHWRPDLALWVESELWPALIAATAARNIPMVLVNARMSDRSARRWGMLPGLARAVLGRFDLCLARNAEQAERFRALGARRVEVTGNLKFAAAPLPAAAAAHDALKAAIGERPSWLAASTHDGEEQAAIEAHRRLASRHPDLLTIIVPRHPKRGAEIAALAEAAGLPAARRSLDALPTPSCAVYVADTLGEMGLFFTLAGEQKGLVFVGGSLTRRGGHNPLEPAHFGCAILHGPDMRNNLEMAEALAEADAARIVATPEALAETVEKLFTAPAERHRLADAASRVAHAHAGVLDRAMTALAPVLARLPA
ncbi:3-deoxy-D-manno-octulosonic acid transferase [Oceanibaculum nanhaiense]|uniref:3-deoxy-D-manno-octulosonic acid transferase n=1 Tax=Oceanibaculum nanhaiense TaxID=1909734 RepID=UPI003D2DDB40